MRKRSRDAQLEAPVEQAKEKPALGAVSGTEGGMLEGPSARGKRDKQLSQDPANKEKLVWTLCPRLGCAGQL